MVKYLKMKTMLFCFWLTVPMVSFGQKNHEAKMDFLIPFFKGIHFAYEYMPNVKSGVELSIMYRWGIDGAYAITPYPQSPEPETFFIEAEQTTLILTLAGKYYIAENQKADGLYTGAYFRNDILVTREIDLYDILTLPEYNHKKQSSRYLRTGLGILLGYKLYIRTNFLVDASMGFDANLFTVFDTKKRTIDLAGIPTLKAGYRF